MNRTILITLLFLLLMPAAPASLMAQHTAAQQEQNAPANHGKDTTPRSAKQQRRSHTRSGNHNYNKGRYEDAESHYRLALKADSNYYKAQYNLGDAMYRQHNYPDAIRHYSQSLNDPRLQGKQKSHAYYNLGNSHLQAGLQQRKNAASQGAANSAQQDDGGMAHFQEAVKNYQEALKLNAKDQNAKYNLSYAQKMLAQSQQQNNGKGQQNKQNGQGQNQQNQQGQGQNQQGQQGQQGQQKQQGQDQQKQDQQKQQQGKQGQQGQDQQKKKQEQMQKEQRKREAEQLLGAVKNNEKNTMQEQIRAKESKVDSRIEKDW